MRKPATTLLLTGLLVLVCGLSAQETKTQHNPAAPTPDQSQRQSEPTTTLRVDVNLVNVFVTVTDARGAPIGGLTEENFALKEDDHEQRIAGFDKESALPPSIAPPRDTTCHWNRPRPGASRMPSCARSTQSACTALVKS